MRKLTPVHTYALAVFVVGLSLFAALPPASANPGVGSFQLLNGIAVTSGGQGWTVGQVEEQSLIERACGL